MPGMIWDKHTLFTPRHQTTLVPPVRLDIHEVEKSLQDECNKRLEQQQTIKQMSKSKQLNGNTDWTKLFSFPDLIDSTASTPDDTNGHINENTNSQQNDINNNNNNNNNTADISVSHITLKRVRPLSIFERSKSRKYNTNNLDIVLDKQNFTTQFQKHQDWYTKTVGSQKDDQSTTSIQILEESPATATTIVSDHTQQPPQTNSMNSQERILVEDILGEVLGDTDYSTRNRIISPNKKATTDATTEVVINEPSVTASSQTTTTTVEPSHTLPVEMSLSTPTTNTEAIATDINGELVSTVEIAANNESQQSLLDSTTSFPPQTIPVLATQFQLDTVARESEHIIKQSTGGVKHRIGKVIDILNHPMHALIPGYISTGSDIWSGSGKTMFIQELLLRLKESAKEMDVLLACYDLNMEEFLTDLLKNKFTFDRLNTLAKSGWFGEYGLVVRFRTSSSQQPPLTEGKTQLVLIIDPRLQDVNPIVKLIQNDESNVSIPILYLVAWNSVEGRLLEYLRKQDPPSWRLPDQDSRMLIFDTSQDTSMDDLKLKQSTSSVVDSVMKWINSGMTDIYRYSGSTDIESEAITLQQPSLLSSSVEGMALKPSITTTQPTTTTTTSAVVSTQSTMEIAGDREHMGEEQMASSQSSLTDMEKLFSHVSVPRLQSELKSWKSKIINTSKQDHLTISDDDSFYSAESETPTDDHASLIQNILGNITGQSSSLTEPSNNARQILKSLKADFDNKCLNKLETLLSTYQTELMTLQREYVEQANKQLDATFSGSINQNQ
ncbi:uncharacterized protein BX664DRAFT_331687 [Halteromyces radiatus]|uniref:uncharacterized protein n=1 Tax=Halteromyces radiatus TaxID=101107 RepID=UPI00221EFA78|nr:uncharacterized protein BX664DRAFT_331687 [Halteromyces radiatus]KAI8088898.1 hypothetical protein BX664DRAFT_331687 [Halteromyces radiatus]